MATIIDLKDVSRTTPCAAQRPMSGGSAQIYLFTGIRYERGAGSEPAQLPRRRGVRKSAQTNSQE